MPEKREEAVVDICRRYRDDPTRVMDIVLDVQREFRCVDDEAIDAIARCVGTPRVDIESVVTFYTFLSKEPHGEVVIRLCNDVVDEMKGALEVAEALEDELGIAFGETTPDGRFTLEWASCIGMSDQAPAALVNDFVVTDLAPGKARRGVRLLKMLQDPVDAHDVLVRDFGDGNNAHELVRACVRNNLRRPGEVIFADSEPGAAIDHALAMSPAEVIRQVKTARLRGRGGAGFPTGMKWEFTRATAADQRYVICNADEGEPGTFKDRVILTERPDLMFEGMTVAGYAIGATKGIVYLRAEYAYLRPLLEDVLERRRRDGLLGESIRGREGFDFDIRIQMGAGAYICGEETALINSCEGKRGDPLNRPPFPAQQGYLGKPTSVNNCETLCCAARILEKGAAWFSGIGSEASAGTKLLSISGDCRTPGVFEVPFGVTLREVFKMCDAVMPTAVQVGGPSGKMVGEADFDRTICFDDLATGGSIVIFGPNRNPVEVVSRFLEFFVHESCGYCTPCRVGNVLLKERIDRILDGQGEPADLDYLDELAHTVKTTSRCGLGQTSPHPVLSTLESFRPAYEALVREPIDGMQPSFDLLQAVAESERLVGRRMAEEGAALEGEAS